MTEKKLKIDFGSGYSPKKGYKTCDITFAPNLDYCYLVEENKILFLETNSVDEFFLKNVVHHIKDLSKTFFMLKSYLKTGGKLVIIDANSNFYNINLFLDRLWYRGILQNKQVWFSEVYRNYFKELSQLGFKLKKSYIKEEKEVSIWIKL